LVLGAFGSCHRHREDVPERDLRTVPNTLQLYPEKTERIDQNLDLRLTSWPVSMPVTIRSISALISVNDDAVSTSVSGTSVALP
jgi:hypothetical protein